MLGCSSSSTETNPVDSGSAGDSGAGKDVGSDAPADSAPAADTTGAGGDGADAADGAKPVAPTQLRSVETTAEGVSDACKVPDYVKAGNVLTEATTVWAALKPQLKSAGATDAQLKKIDDTFALLAADIPAKSQKACETDGNVVTLAVPDLFDYFSWPVPSDALRGDGVFRQLQIDGEYSDWALTAGDLKATKDVWARLKTITAVRAPMRPDIPGASTVVADLDKAIADCETAIGARDAAALQAAAQNGLDAIDVVETIFK
ncbi:MAG: hypothetical protein NVS3B10_24700 [Polyangiales bacterium]